MTRFRIVATFPDLPAGHAQQEAVMEETHFRVAINRALMKILADPHVKRRRISSGVIRFYKVSEPKPKSGH